MRKVVLSGGPSTGKSTTFAALREVYPDAHFIEEPAERVIRRELDTQRQNPDYEPRLPTTRFEEFTTELIEELTKDESATPPDADLVIMDRCFVDNLGYLAYNGVTHMMPLVRQRIRSAGYRLAFFCDWLGTLEQTEIRRETAEEGLVIHGHLEAAYYASAVPVVHLPAVSVEERITIIQATISDPSFSRIPPTT